MRARPAGERRTRTEGMDVVAWLQRTFFVLAAEFMILSRSARGRSTSLDSLETLLEPGEFSIQVPLRILDSVALSFP